MEKKKNINRKEFLKGVCPSVAFAFFGISFLEACAKEDCSINTDSGFTSNGNVFTIDLSHPNFSSLNTIGGWMNGYGIGLNILLLRISDDTIQAYSNACPHQGTRNLWTLSGDYFTCTDHNNSYNKNCGGNDSLVCYSSSIDGNSLTIST